jgi:hypothetical protein
MVNPEPVLAGFEDTEGGQEIGLSKVEITSNLF